MRRSSGRYLSTVALCQLREGERGIGEAYSKASKSGSATQNKARRREASHAKGRKREEGCIIFAGPAGWLLANVHEELSKYYS